jgi:hypothetical protein
MWLSESLSLQINLRMKEISSRVEEIDRMIQSRMTALETKINVAIRQLESHINETELWIDKAKKTSRVLCSRN